MTYSNDIATTIVNVTNNPIISDKRDWLLNHEGRSSVARIIDDTQIEVLMYSDEDTDTSDLFEIARNNGLLFIHNPKGERFNID